MIPREFPADHLIGFAQLLNQIALAGIDCKSVTQLSKFDLKNGTVCLFVAFVDL